MHPAIAEKSAEIAAICERVGVRKLEVFGSAARGDDFDPVKSDADFLVEFFPSARRGWLAEYFELREQLSALLNLSVDLVEPVAVTNPYLLEEINRDREMIFAA